jgi:hypothetical protein
MCRCTLGNDIASHDDPLAFTSAYGIALVQRIHLRLDAVASPEQKYNRTLLHTTHLGGDVHRAAAVDHTAQCHNDTCQYYVESNQTTSWGEMCVRMRGALCHRALRPLHPSCA